LGAFRYADANGFTSDSSMLNAMLNVTGSRLGGFYDGLTRRCLLRLGGLGLGTLGLSGLTLPELLQLRAQADTRESRARRQKSVIMIVLPGGPSHIDTYDLKPDAPAEYRGEFRPIASNVPGIDLCELLPCQARLADKLAIIRSFQVKSDLQHALHEVYTGFPGEPNQAFPGGRALRPAFGSIISQLRGAQAQLPAYVSLRHSTIGRAVPVAEDPAYLGSAHRPFVPSGPALQNFELPRGVSLDRFAERQSLLQSVDKFRQESDSSGDMAGLDEFGARARDLISSSRVRDAFDVSREPESVRRAYETPDLGKYKEQSLALLQARRLVEAGVPVVTVTFGGWDHHSAVGEPPIFTSLRSLLPAYDHAVAALINDLHQSGLSDDVAVAIWGEFGRTPRVSERAGRDHWPPAGFVLFAGGGFKTGQVIGGTDRRAERPTSTPITPQNVLATLYQFLGIDPATTLADHQGRPIALLDDPSPIAELG
jgi:hypothetical protein